MSQSELQLSELSVFCSYTESESQADILPITLAPSASLVILDSSLESIYGLFKLFMTVAPEEYVAIDSDSDISDDSLTDDELDRPSLFKQPNETFRHNEEEDPESRAS